MPRRTADGIRLRSRAALSARIRRLAGTEELEARLDHGEQRLGRLEQRVGRLEEAAQAYFAGNDQRVGRLESLAAIGPVMDWIEQATLATEPLVSVILPTYNRAAMLPRAIETVLAQTYPRWELVIVDDASEDDTAAIVASARCGSITAGSAPRATPGSRQPRERWSPISTTTMRCIRAGSSRSSGLSSSVRRSR